MQEIDDFISRLIHKILEHDAPKQLSVTAKEALERRIAPYKTIAAVTLLFYVLLMVGLILWLIFLPTPPYPWGTAAVGCFGFYMLASALLIALGNAIAAFLIKRWRFADFHTTVAYHLDWGPHGLSIGLALWFLLLIIMFLGGIADSYH